MEDMTARLIMALRKAAGHARCAEDANELNELADALDAEGAPIPAPSPEPAPPEELKAAPAKKRGGKDEGA